MHSRHAEDTMLRICYLQTETGPRWTLCGQLAGPWVEELRACWEDLRKITSGAHTLVDLSEVTFIDESGEKLLAEIGRGGARFVAAGVDTKEMLRNLKANGERPLRRSIVPVADRGERAELTDGKRVKDQFDLHVHRRWRPACVCYRPR
jgi:hypothetical protein